MKKKHVLLIMIFGVTLTSCKNENEDCTLKQSQFDDEIFYDEGCLKNNLEEGKWIRYDHLHRPIEWGTFTNGLRFGDWHYPQLANDSIVNWKKFEKKNLNLRFNIPTKLEAVEDSSQYIKFSNQDSLKLFNVVLAENSLKALNTDIENYYKIGEKEIIDRGWDFTSTRNNIFSNQNIYYFNEYTVRSNSEILFKVLNFYKKIESDKIFEISCRYSPLIEASARMVFFSILTNCFYKYKKIINPFEKIKLSVIK